MRIWQKRSLAALLGLVTALGLAEVGLRLWWTPFSARATQLHEPHPLYGYRPIPGAIGRAACSEYEHPVTHSPWGWRDLEEFPPPTDDPRPRLMLLGDSFLYGLGLDDHETLTRMLRQELPGWRIDGFAASGFGQFQQLAVLDHLGPDYRPDVVLPLLYWNDLEDNLDPDAPHYAFDGLHRVTRSDGVDPTTIPIDRAAPRPAPRRDPPPSYLRELVRDGFVTLRYRWFGIGTRPIQNTADRDRAWTTTERALDLLAARSSELGADFAITCIPGQTRVDPGARIPGIEPLHYEVEEHLAEFCGRRDMPWLPTLEPLQAAAAAHDTPLYYYADRHLTPAGARAFAAALAEQVTRRFGRRTEPR